MAAVLRHRRRFQPITMATLSFLDPTFSLVWVFLPVPVNIGAIIARTTLPPVLHFFQNDSSLLNRAQIHLLHRLEAGLSISASAELSSEGRVALRNAVGIAPRRTTSSPRPGCIHPTNVHAPAPLGESRSRASRPHSLLRTDTVLRGSSAQSVRGHRTRKGHRPAPLHLSIPRPQ